MSISTFKGMGKKDNTRKYSSGGFRPDHTAYKRTEAKERAEAWAKLTPAEQLAQLDRRLGKDQGAQKQRARIKARAACKPVAPRIDAASVAAQVAEANAAATGPVRMKAKDRRAIERGERGSR